MENLFNENLFNDLMKEFFDSMTTTLNSISLEGFDIKTEKNGNCLTITAVQKPLEPDLELLDYIDLFKSYVDKTADYIFDPACDKFAEESDITLEDLEVLVDEAKDKESIYKYTSQFKDCIKSAAKDFINELKETYELD